MLIPMNPSELPERTHKVDHKGNMKILEDFLASGAACAEYVDEQKRKPEILAANFVKAKDRGGYPVVISRRKDRIFFIREG